MPEGKLKIVGIPGGVPKFEEKTWISRRVNTKKVEIFRIVIVKSTGKGD